MAVILIVEDEFFIRGVAEVMIQGWGHQTLSATNQDEALALLRSPQRIDALFTDLRLKTSALDGCELARQALELRPELRVLYTTGNPLTDPVRALFVGGAHFLAKPYTPRRLQDAVEGMLAA